MDQIVKYGVPIVSVILSILLATYTYFIHSRLKEIVGESDDMKKALDANIFMVREAIEKNIPILNDNARQANSKISKQNEAIDSIDTTMAYVIENQNTLRKATKELTDVMATESKHIDTRMPDEFRYREPTPPRTSRTRRTKNKVRSHESEDDDDEEEAMILSRRKKKQS